MESKGCKFCMPISLTDPLFDAKSGTRDIMGYIAKDDVYKPAYIEVIDNDGAISRTYISYCPICGRFLGDEE